MLNGIGGATIAEAKERMPQDELQTWVQYRRKHGGLNLGLRIEQGAGLTAYFANGGRGQLSDYLPQRTADEEASLDRAMKEWR